MSPKTSGVLNDRKYKLSSCEDLIPSNLGSGNDLQKLKILLDEYTVMSEGGPTNRAHFNILQILSKELSANGAGLRLKTVLGNDSIFDFYFSLIATSSFANDFVEFFLAVRAGVVRLCGPIVDTSVAELMVAIFKS